VPAFIAPFRTVLLRNFWRFYDDICLAWGSWLAAAQGIGSAAARSEPREALNIQCYRLRDCVVLLHCINPDHLVKETMVLL
jgi:hypothetical protein